MPKLEGISASCWHVCMSHVHLHFTDQCWRCGVFCTHGPPVCLGCLRNSAPMPTSTQQAPSARTVGDFRQSLACPHVSHPPTYWCWQCGIFCTHSPQVCLWCLGTQSWRLSALSRHPVGPQCLNWRGFPSVTGASASLASACAIHTGAGSAVLSAQMALWCASGA